MSNLEAKVTLDWGDGTYSFRLTVNGLLELEEKCSAPFTEIYGRLTAGRYSISDLRETIRLGLIGGGLEPAKALPLIRRYVDERPKAESQKVAQVVLGATLFGFQVAPLGNQEAAPEAEENPNVSTPPSSIETLLSSAISHLPTSTASRFGNGQQP